MEFEDMKVIWDSQNEEQLYAVNRDGLRSMLRDRARDFKRLVFWQEAQTYGSSLFVVAVISIALIGYFTGGLERLSGVKMNAWDAAALFAGVVCWAQFGIRVYWERSRQRARESAPAETLMSELDRDLAKVNFEIGARRSGVLVRAYIPPHLGGMLFIWVVFRASGLPVWSIGPFIGVMLCVLILETRWQRRLVANKLMPRKEELETLRGKLVQSER